MAESGFLFPQNIALFPRSAPFRPLLFRRGPLRSFGAGPPPRRYRPKQQCSMLPRTEGRSALFRAFRSFRTFGCSRRSGCSKHSGHSVVPIVPAASVVKSSRSLPSVRRFRLHPSPAATPCPAPANPPPDRFDSRPPVPNFSTGPPRRPRRAKRRQRKYPAAEAPGISFVCDRGRFSPGRADRAGSSPAPSPHLRLPTAPLEATAARDSPQGTERIVRTPPSPEAAARAIRIRRYAFEPS